MGSSAARRPPPPPHRDPETHDYVHAIDGRFIQELAEQYKVYEIKSETQGVEIASEEAWLYVLALRAGGLKAHLGKSGRDGTSGSFVLPIWNDNVTYESPRNGVILYKINPEEPSTPKPYEKPAPKPIPVPVPVKPRILTEEEEYGGPQGQWPGQPGWTFEDSYAGVILKYFGRAMSPRSNPYYPRVPGPVVAPVEPVPVP